LPEVDGVARLSRRPAEMTAGWRHAYRQALRQLVGVRGSAPALRADGGCGGCAHRSMRDYLVVVLTVDPDAVLLSFGGCRCGDPRI
jgi:hypothetical protein